MGLNMALIITMQKYSWPQAKPQYNIHKKDSYIIMKLQMYVSNNQQAK